jgi:hypothetical protein
MTYTKPPRISEALAAFLHINKNKVAKIRGNPKNSKEFPTLSTQ